MAQRPHVPAFGKWENDDNVPYTLYFDKARKGRGGGKMINPNDPQENPDMFPNTVVPPAQDQRPTSKEDGEFRQLTDSPARNNNTGRRISGESPNHRNGGRPVRQSSGPDRPIDRSPLHRSASPGGEEKNSFDSSHGAPGRSRMKPVNRGEEAPKRNVAVPVFGDWEKNPSTADGYTDIFNTVLQQKHEGTRKAPGGGNEPPYTTPRKQNTTDDAKCSCFPWGGK
ncbi:hypothetical protein U1Q18_033802 [Sarracenia purpurea var. burkii]